MTRVPWALVNYGWLRSQLHGVPVKERDVPVRTVFNSQTQQEETVPLTEFQQLLRQGKIQETIRWGRCGTPVSRVYRLV